MLSDAISSEGYKLTRNRWTAFWALLFAPVLSLLTSLFQLTQIVSKIPAELRAAAPQDLSAALLQRAWGTTPETVSYFVAMLFVMFGAAVVFGGDYRWETWRLIAPRNSRLSILLGKIIVVILGVLATTALLMLVGLGVAALTGAVNGSEITWTFGAKPNYWLVLVCLFGVSALQLIQACALVALAAILTRSMMFGLLAPLFVGIVQFGFQMVVTQGGATAPELHQVLLLPGLSADILRQHVGSVLISGAQNIPEDLARQSLLSLLGWITVGFGGALALFMRQDLSKE